MTNLLVVGCLFGGAFAVVAVLWCVAALSGQIADTEEQEAGIRRS